MPDPKNKKKELPKKVDITLANNLKMVLKKHKRQSNKPIDVDRKILDNKFKKGIYPEMIINPINMEKPKNKKVRDTVRINKPSKIYKPGDHVTEDDFEAQFKKIEGNSSTFPQYSVEDYSTIQVDKKGPYVVKNPINMGSPLYAKLTAKCKAAARRKFDVYPSAYANMWASKQQKKGKC